MRVAVDGEKVIHKNNDCRNQEYCLGLITFNIEEGRHKIEAKLLDTPIRRISNIITFVSILIVAGLIFRIKNEKYAS